jgi:hypothetical protein
MFERIPELRLLCRVFCWATLQEDIEETQGGVAERSAQAMAGKRPEVMMVLFSRSFIRRRVVSLVVTSSVTATSFALAKDPSSTHLVRTEERPFMSENATAMKKMMTDMMIRPSGDVDRDFVEMMVPHHQGAVDMAKAELKYGHNEQLRRLARGIVVNQQHEITEMRGAIGGEGSSPASADGVAADGAMKMSQ